MSFLTVLLFAINDITTTPENAPAFVTIAELPVHQGKDLTYQTFLAARQKRLYPDLFPLQSKAPRHELFSRVVTAAKSQNNWEIIYMDASHYRIEAVVTTPLMKFRDDVVIEVREEKSGSSLHMRSKSRIGRNDFGANYNRIQDFLNLFR